MSDNLRENAVILNLCKPDSCDSEAVSAAFGTPLNLPYILGQLLFHRIGGIAYHNLSQCGILPKLNREFRNPLGMIYEAFAERTKSFLRAEALLAEVLSEAVFPLALLKGAYLARLYPIGTRTSNDFDVLINPNDVQNISGLLLDRGFTQGFLRAGEFTPATRAEIVYARMNKGETVPFVKQLNLPHMPYLEIDVNFSLGFGSGKDTDAVGAMLSRTESLIETTHGNLPTLCRTDFLIHLCAHLYKEATTFHWVKAGRDLSLYKFCDILLFIDRFMDEDFAERLIISAKELGLQKECYYAFYYTRKLFDIQNALFDVVIAAVRPESTGFMRQIIDPQGKRTLRHDLNFVDYLFHPNRLEILTEV